MVHGNIHRTVLVRLALVGATLSAILGTAAFELEMGKADARMLELATAESKSFTEHVAEHNPHDPAHIATLRQRAEEFLKSDFVSVRVYDTTRKMFLEVVEPGGAASGSGLGPHVHPLQPGDRSHYHTYWAGRQPYMQVLLPIEKEGALLGYFEGVYKVTPETAQAMTAGIARTVALVVIVVLVTATAIYPVIIHLNKDLIARSAELLKSNVELMEVLGSAIAKRDSDTHLHNYRVTICAVRLAEKLELSRPDIARLIAGAFLHDVGKIGVSDTILLKPARLTKDEFRQIQAHVPLGVDIISKATWLESARDVVEYHHEKFDGSGYMRGLKGEAIPLNARIFAIIDVFDALTSKRPYKEAQSAQDALATMRGASGSHFDPRLLEHFCEIAPALHAEVACAEEGVMKGALRAAISKYFISAAYVKRLRFRRPAVRTESLSKLVSRRKPS